MENQKTKMNVLSNINTCMLHGEDSILESKVKYNNNCDKGNIVNQDCTKCNAVFPSFEKDISVDKPTKTLTSKRPSHKGTCSQASAKNNEIIWLSKDKYEQVNCDKTIEDNECQDYNKTCLLHKRKTELEVLSSKFSVHRGKGNFLNPIKISGLDNIKSAACPSLQTKFKPLKAVHGICHDDDSHATIRKNNIGKLNNNLEITEQNKSDISQPSGIHEGQLKGYNCDSSLSQGACDRRQSVSVNSSLSSSCDGLVARLSENSLQSVEFDGRETFFGKITEDSNVTHGNSQSGFDFFIKSAFGNFNTCEFTKAEKLCTFSQLQENNNTERTTEKQERKPLNVKKKALHYRLKAYFNNNTSKKEQGDLNSYSISSTNSISPKGIDDSNCYNKVNAYLLDTSQNSGQFYACEDKDIHTELSHRDLKAGDNSEKFPTKERGLSDETNIAVGCVNGGNLNQPSYIELPSIRSGSPVDCNKKSNLNILQTGELVSNENSIVPFEKTYERCALGANNFLTHCQEVEIVKDIKSKDSNADTSQIKHILTLNSQDIDKDQLVTETYSEIESTTKTLDSVSSNESTNEDKLVKHNTEADERKNSSEDQNLIILNSSERDETLDNKTFVSSQKKKVALYRGKFVVNAEHHSIVSSNLSLSSSKGSSKRLNVGNVQQFLNMDRPSTHLRTGICSEETLLQPRPNTNKYYIPRNNQNLEMSYTSQDSGYLGPVRYKSSALSSDQQPSELSSLYSESSVLSQSNCEMVTLQQYLHLKRSRGSGQSDTSQSKDMDVPLSRYKKEKSKSYTDITSKSKSRKQKKKAMLLSASNNGRSKSSYDFCDSVNTLSHDNTLESLDSAHSSLYLLNSPRLRTMENSNSPILGISARKAYRNSTHFNENEFSFENGMELSKKFKKCKNKPWGTVGNIPGTVKQDRSMESFLRTKSFDYGKGMHRARRSYEMIDRIESESEDSDSSIDIDHIDDFSMADDASHVGGCSQDDKLRLAASKGQVERIPTLLAQGAGFQPDKEGRTAIHYAALSGYSEAVRILAANGCDVNTQDNLGYSALHRAAAQGHLEVVRVLCDCRCHLDIQDDVHGNSALHEAAWNGYSRTVELLCQYKASVQLVNKAGFSALHLAAQNGHNQSGRSLLYAGCDANHKNNYGDTPLHTAGRYGHAGVTRILLSAKCRISEQNKNGDTALHISAALKRRKIAKLLVESNINISLKNKQNETAADVSRRKEHPEILLIITSQPKLHKQKKKEDKKKKKEGKISGIEESDDPRKDKKMFFFRKRSKSKDKENKENREASTDRLESRPYTAPSSLEGQAGAGSDVHSHSSGGDANRGLKNRTASKERLARSQGTTTKAQSGDKNHKKVHGLLTQYEAKTGVQYYRDLAGNIKQGPIGFAPVCNCGPSIKKIEQRMEADKNNLYDHIDATHKMLSHKMEDIDHKCNHRVQSADRVHQQQMEDTQRTQQNWVNSRILHEKQETDKMMRFQEHLMRSEYMDYVGRKVGAFESHYAPLPSRCKGCDHCSQGKHHHGHYRDDNDLNPSNMPYSVYQQGTGLYRSKSDETLSISSSHPSKRHWKMKAKSIRELKDKYLRTEGYQAERIEKDLQFQGVRPPPQGQGGGIQGNGQERSNTIYHYEDVKSSQPLSSGRSPEGQSSNNEYSEQSSYLDPVSHYGTWNRKRKPINSDLMQQLSDKDTMQQDFEKLTVRDYPQSSLSNGQSTSTPVAQIQRPQSGPQLSSSHLPQLNSAQTTPDVNIAYNAPYNTPAYNTPNYNTPNSSYNTTHNNSSRLTTSGSSSYVLSPEQVQVHHTKTDSGSNPDSGYSSKIYGIRPTVSGRSISTNAASPDNINHIQQLQQPDLSQYSQMRTMGLPQQQQQQQQQRYDVSPTKTVHRNRGYSSDGCPGMRRPKQDAYASDNCSGMRMKKPVYKSSLNDWYEKQVSGKGNGVINEVPIPSQPQMNGHASKPRDFWPGKATQV